MTVIIVKGGEEALKQRKVKLKLKRLIPLEIKRYLHIHDIRMEH